MDLTDSELLAPFTLVGLNDPVDGVEKGLCADRANVTIVEDSATTAYRGLLHFEQNYATGSSDGFCGTGCGGALFVGAYSSADLGRINFARNTATDGGALYVDALADLSLSLTPPH